MKRTAAVALALSVLAGPAAAAEAAARLQGFLSGLTVEVAGSAYPDTATEGAYIVRYTPCGCPVTGPVAERLDDFTAIDAKLRAAERRIDDRARFENMPVEGF